MFGEETLTTGRECREVESWTKGGWTSGGGCGGGGETASLVARLEEEDTEGDKEETDKVCSASPSSSWASGEGGDNSFSSAGDLSGVDGVEGTEGRGEGKGEGEGDSEGLEGS